MDSGQHIRYAGRKMFSHVTKLLAGGWFAFLLLAGCDAPPSTTGQWSVPSLSQPGESMIFTLHPDGRAEETIGSYHGTGRWKTEGGQTYIYWDSGWLGLLRPTGKNSFELMTWKKGTPHNRPADDRQPARRLGAPRS